MSTVALAMPADEPEIPLPAQILIRRILREQRAIALLEALEQALQLDPEPEPYQPSETITIGRMHGPGFAMTS